MLRFFFWRRLGIAVSSILLVAISLPLMATQVAFAQRSIPTINPNQHSVNTQSANAVISSDVVWQDTGISLNVGDTLTVSATGSWSADPGDGFTSPDGYPQQAPDNFLNLTDIGVCAFCASTPTPHWGALIGYIGNNPPAAGSYTSSSVLPDAQKVFVVGSNYQSSASLAGELWLNFNDDAYSANTGDNAGQVTATVTNTPAAPHRQLIIFLQGITTSLTGKQANSGTIVGMGAVPSSVKLVFPGASTNPSASTRFLEYSYFASRTDNGLPGAYNCTDTITNSLNLDALLLDKQIKNAFNVEPPGSEVDIYLIGHSLGGTVALTYLEFLEQNLLVSLPPHGHLKAVMTLDSPIGGVSKGFFTINSLLGTKILKANCPAANGQPFTSPKDLENVFGSISNTTSPDDPGSDPQGARASFLAVYLGTPPPPPLPSNEDLIQQAQTNLGTSFLSVGNLNDFLWNPHACAAILPSFLDTQFFEDTGDGNGIYGRDFVSGQGTCPGITNFNKTKQIVNANHSAVLSDGNVQLGIENFLKPLAIGNSGGTPSPLPINPFQPTGS